MVLPVDDVRWRQRFNNYNKAFKQLSVAVSLYETRSLTAIETQGLIKSFEFTLELAWNLLKDYQEFMGIADILGGKNAIRQAFKNGLIDQGQEWLDMIEDRNLSAHTYDEELAISLAKNIAEKHFSEFNKLQIKFAKLMETP